jgi:hypothetical protein
MFKMKKKLKNEVLTNIEKEINIPHADMPLLDL